jgi:hypothetical protein
LPFPGKAQQRQGVFLHRGALHLVGGNRSAGPHDFAAENFLAEGFSIDLGTLALEPVAPLPAPRQSMEMLSAADDPSTPAWAIGGFGPGPEGEAVSSAAVWAFDPRRREFLPVSTLAEPRTQCGAARWGGKLWVFGGLDYDAARGEADAFRHPLEVLAWDPVEDAGKPFADSGHRLPRPRRAFGGALLGGRYYLVGGMRERFQAVEDCDVFDFASGSWSSIPPPRRPRLSPALVAAGGRLYLAGGSARGSGGGSGFEPDRSIEVFDAEAGAWQVLLEELPGETRAQHVLPAGDSLLLLRIDAAGARAELGRLAKLDAGRGRASG